MLLDPCNHGAHDKWSDVLLELQQESHYKELDQLTIVGHQHPLHKGKSILRVLANVAFDVLFQSAFVLFNLQLIGQLSILLKSDLLSHATLQ